MFPVKLSLVPDSANISFACSGVKFGYASSNSAIIPVTIGADIEVPCKAAKYQLFVPSVTPVDTVVEFCV